MSNAIISSDGLGHPLVCPLLQLMKEGRHNANATAGSLAVVWVHGLVSLLGILENALILWVVGFGLRCRRTVASVWVLNLAMSDFLATLTLPLFTHYLHRAHSWDLPPALCSAQASIFFLNMFVSAFLLAAISIDRCLLVARPAWCQNRRSVAAAWKVCALGWLWAVVNTFPYLLFRGVTTRRDGRNLCYNNFAYLSSPATLRRDCEVRHTATAVSKMLLAFLMPLVVIAGSYVLFVRGLRRRARRRRTQTGSPCSSPCRPPDTTVGAKTEKSTINALLKPPALPAAPARRALSSTSNPLFPASSSSSKSAHNQTGQQQQQLSQSFTKMVTSVIAAFVLCWAPYHIFCVIEAAAAVAASAEDRRRKLYLVEVGLPIASTLAFLNSVLNPVLYAFCCPHFCVKIRQSLGAVFEGLLEEGEGGGGGIGRKLSVPGIGRKLDKGKAAAGCSRELSGAASPVSQGHGSPRPPARNPPSTLLLSSTQHPQRCPKAREMEMAERRETNGEEKRQPDE